MYIKHNNSDKKSAFSLGKYVSNTELKPQRVLARQMLYQQVADLPLCVCVCVCVCVCARFGLSLRFKVTAVCCQEISTSAATLWLTCVWRCFPAVRIYCDSTANKARLPSGFDPPSAEHHVKLREPSRCFGVLFLGLFNHGAPLPTLERHGWQHPKNWISSTRGGKKKKKENCRGLSDTE